MREQEVATLAVVAVVQKQARMWQFPLASSHLADVQMRKQNKKKVGVWMLPGGGKELGVCQVN